MSNILKQYSAFLSQGAKKSVSIASHLRGIFSLNWNCRNNFSFQTSPVKPPGTVKSCEVAIMYPHSWEVDTKKLADHKYICQKDTTTQLQWYRMSISSTLNWLSCNVGTSKGCHHARQDLGFHSIHPGHDQPAGLDRTNLCARKWYSKHCMQMTKCMILYGVCHTIIKCLCMNPSLFTWRKYDGLLEDNFIATPSSRKALQ